MTAALRAQCRISTRRTIARYEVHRAPAGHAKRLPQSREDNKQPAIHLRHFVRAPVAQTVVKLGQAIRDITSPASKERIKRLVGVDVAKCQTPFGECTSCVSNARKHQHWRGDNGAAREGRILFRLGNKRCVRRFVHGFQRGSHI